MAATCRHSGSATSSDRIFRPGSRRGRNTVASAGLLTSLLMLAMMMAVLRLMGVSLERKPRMSRGTMMDRAGLSTCCTKVVADSLTMALLASAGRAMQLSMRGTQGSMSRLPCSLKHELMAVYAAFLTCSRASTMHSLPTGTISGKASCTCALAVVASLRSSFKDPSLHCHCLSLDMPSSTYCSTNDAAGGFKMSVSALAAASAAALTAGFLSACRSSTRPSMGTK
mmetsp:Transcript_23781/g.65366  ORF Transcript_23781/g.65366 Transcript_23781/m.65366 type:complete len:226 (-) Transcript_23781:593-1270(-)